MKSQKIWNINQHYGKEWDLFIYESLDFFFLFYLILYTL